MRSWPVFYARARVMRHDVTRGGNLLQAVGEPPKHNPNSAAASIELTTTDCSTDCSSVELPFIDTFPLPLSSHCLEL